MMNEKFYDPNVYKSEEMRNCIAKAQALAGSKKEVLILGEEGTERDFIAKFIHQQGNKNVNLPFVSIKCASIPDSLFQMELFGEYKNYGLLEKTGKGTIYLEDISELSLFSQSMLLEVIKNRSFRRLGECQDTTIHCRIIVSSEKDLLALVNENKFNLELFYLISAVPINIPSLRNRPEDIEALANYMIDIHNKSSIYNKKFLHPATIKLLKSYDWPGNTIELNNVISRALHFTQNNAIKPEDINFIHVQPQEYHSFSHSLRSLVQTYEKKIVEETLKKYKSARKAATVLEVSHTTILKKIRKYGLEAYINREFVDEVIK